MVKATTIRMDESLKREAVAVLDSIGMSFNTYVTAATKQLVNQRRVPFDLVAPSAEPTDQTRRALVEAQARELGLIPDSSPRFDSAEAAMAYLENSD